MKKLILILVIITFIGFIVIIAKSRLDSGLSKKVFAELSELTKELEEEANLEIYFQDVEVNSFGMEVLIKNLELENGTDLFSVEELKLGTSYEELLNIIKTQTFDRIESLALELKNANIEYQHETWDYNDYSWKNKTISLEVADNIKINYTGVLTQEVVESFLNEKLPETDYTLLVEVVGINPENYAQIFGSDDEIEINYNVFGKHDFGFGLEFLPSIRKVLIKNAYHKNKYGEATINLMANYKGNTLDNFVLKKIEVNSKSSFDFNNLKSSSIFSELNEAVDENIEIIFNNFDQSFNFSIKGDPLEMIFYDDDYPAKLLNKIKLESTISMLDFSVKMPDVIMREIRRDVPQFPQLKNNRFHLRKLHGNFGWNNDQFKSNLSIVNSLFSIEGELDIKISSSPDKTRINACIFQINNMLNEDFVSTLINGAFGPGTYSQLPKSGNAITINVSGLVLSPKIKLKNGYKTIY